MQKIQVISQPSFPAVATADMVNYLRLYDNYESTLIAQLVDAATDLFQAHTGMVLCNQTQVLRLDGWVIQNPLNYYQNLLQPESNIIYIPRYPVSSIVSVQYLDTTGTLQTLTGWEYDTVSTPARVILPQGTLPALYNTAGGCVQVTYNCGYSTAANIPNAALVAVMLLGSHWYNNRAAYSENEMTEIPQAFLALTKRFSLEMTNWNRSTLGVNRYGL